MSWRCNDGTQSVPVSCPRRAWAPGTESIHEGECMDYQIHVKRVEEQRTGVVRCRAGLAELTQVVPRACGEVWTFFRSSGLPRPGRGLALYLDDEINLECGVEVEQPFDGKDQVFCSHTPGGLGSSTAH